MVSPPENEEVISWHKVKEQTLAGLLLTTVVTIVGGIGYIAYTVPSKLDHVINNQEEFRARLIKLENHDENQEIRIIKLESARR